MNTMNRAYINHLKKAMEPNHPYRIFPIHNNMLEIHFSVNGPKETIYEGGLYHGAIKVKNDFPFSYPTMHFL